MGAALFAFHSPLSRGALLADEVGLGKTIEAGLVIAQKWAERKRRILIIAPANLRKQWYLELQEKFFLPSVVLEAKSYNAEIKADNFRPFDRQDAIVICSYHFAKAKAGDIANTDWDLVVIDEAHRLRNVYKPNNVIANVLKGALQPYRKLLLTATPLQNSLQELFGLVSIIDDHAFGDIRSFREQYARLDDASFGILKARLKPVCHRTLRRQVTQYINYTARHAMVEQFTPEDAETQLYDDVSEYLRRPNLIALPNSQRALMTLVLRKLLASSTFAIAGALDTLIRRLEGKLRTGEAEVDLVDELDQDYEALDELADEWAEEEQDIPLTQDEADALRKEIGDLTRFRDLATSITNNAKGKALLKALKQAFAKTADLGGARKAILFTESRKTQDYLVRLLEGSDFAEGIVLFNGSNTDRRSKEIYKSWLERHGNTDRATGSRQADMRTAIVDYFREQGTILIATEAGAEGINLQFCSLVVNYDLPWNPQRIEQRIGRAHRYGQKHDVVVLNFVNLKNAADQRVYELLNEKFKLFEGVFGASDEVLGAIESGVDLEKRIADIYQKCRTHDEITAAFDNLQAEFQFEIEEEIKSTRVQLIENLDQEVVEKLRLDKRESEAALHGYERMLMDLTRHELKDHADFSGADGQFCLRSNPFPDVDVPTGLYELPRRSGEAHFYRKGHPLAEQVIERAMKRDLQPVEIVFDYTNTPGKVSLLEPLIGKSGELSVSLLTIEALDQAEDYLILAGVSDDGRELEPDAIHRMLSLQVASQAQPAQRLLSHKMHLFEIAQSLKTRLRWDIAQRNASFVEQEAAKLESWAEDLRVGLERELKELDRQIKEAKKVSTLAPSLDEKLETQRLVRKLEADRAIRRRSIFDAQDEIDRRRGGLIESLERKLRESHSEQPLLCVRWRLQ